MNKQLSEKEKFKLNELLQVNIISNTQNEKTSRQKIKSLKFINTDLFNNNNKEISYRNRPNLTGNSFYHNYTKNNNKTSRKVSYKPRRLVKLTGGEMPLKLLGKATLDLTKTFYKVEQDDFDKKISSTGKANKAINFLDNEISNIDTQVEFKASSGIKFAQSMTNLYKLKKNVDLMNENRKRNYEELFNKILKLLDYQSQLFLIDENEDNNNLTTKTSSTFNTLSSRKTSTLNYKSISTEKNINNVSTKMKKLINLCLEIGSTFYKFLYLIFSELREKHNENIRLFKKSNEQEIHINQILKELDSLQKHYNKFDVNAKIYLKQGREQSINNLKERFNKKENQYILNIYKLEEEIRNLTVLLNKNKEFYNKFKETEKEVEKSKRQNEEMKSLYNREIQDKIIQNANEKDKEEELNNKINELEEIIDKFKEDQEISKRKEIETNAKVKKLRMIVNEKNENILMVNEELEWFIREYQKEKFNHSNTKVALQILENRIFKDEDRTEREKNKKDESEDNKENNKISNNEAKKKDEENNEVIQLMLNISHDSNK